MTPYVIGLVCCVLPLFLVAFALLRDWLGDRRFFQWSITNRTPVLCISCRGQGWIGQRQRTLTFTGEGFADIEQPAQPCQACNGTGYVQR